MFRLSAVASMLSVLLAPEIPGREARPSEKIEKREGKADDFRSALERDNQREADLERVRRKPPNTKPISAEEQAGIDFAGAADEPLPPLPAKFKATVRSHGTPVPMMFEREEKMDCEACYAPPKKLRVGLKESYEIQEALFKLRCNGVELEIPINTKRQRSAFSGWYPRCQ